MGVVVETTVTRGGVEEAIIMTGQIIGFEELIFQFMVEVVLRVMESFFVLSGEELFREGVLVVTEGAGFGG